MHGTREIHSPRRTTAYQREVAERNVEAILDAVGELLQSQGHASISAVAAQAGVSRVTVYAHFPTWEALLEAAVERAVRQTVAALESVRPDDGPPTQALDRMLAAAWQHMAQYQGMAAAVAELLSPTAVTRSHQAMYQTIGALLERGQADGSFRIDLPTGWLMTASIALVHACSDGVRAGQIDEHDAVRILTTSVRDLLTGTRPRKQPGRAR
jgi:AcrR family transcriptional regulator